MPLGSEMPSFAAPAIDVPAAFWTSQFLDSPDAQVISDRAGTLVHVNASAARQYRLKSGENLFKTGFFDSQLDVRIRLALQSNSREAVTIPGVQLTSPSAALISGDLELFPMEKGCWLLRIEDASQRVQQETKTQHLIAAIDSTPDVVILTDKDFLITFVNPAFETATGFSGIEAIGRMVDSFHAPGQSKLAGEYKEGLRRGVDWFGELLMQRRNGSRYPVDMTISPVYDRNKDFIGTVAFQRDISARKKLLEALLFERNFAQSIINSLEACLYTLDGKFRITHLNDGWRRIRGEHGWLRFDDPPQEGRCLLDYVVDETKRSQLAETFNQVLAEGKPQDLQSVDDAGRHWTMNIYPWHHEGKIRGLIYRVTDNSAFVGVQSQLFQAQRHCTLGVLVAGVAHDFNNLILAMRGNLGLVCMDNQLAAEARTRLQQVDDAAARATDLSRQLLSFARSTPEESSVVDFNQVVIDAVGLSKKVFRGKIKVQIKSVPEPLKVQIDPTRATQALLNLCINAADAMPSGGMLTINSGPVDLSPGQRAKARGQHDVSFMRCSVADTGTGISSELLPKIFNPFFTTKGEGKGTGLGLAIVNTVVTKAGGFIEVETALGRGTTFHVYLPLDAGALTKLDTELQRQICKGTGRLLVVDDLDLVLDFAANFLRQAGYQVLTANCADAALNLLAQQKLPIDLLFTDYTMPGRNGWQLIQEVLARWPMTRCVLASGYIDQIERAEIEAHSNVRILNKPYGIAEATLTIFEAMGYHDRH